MTLACRFVAVTSTVLMPMLCAAAENGSWPGWRGPNRDNLSPDTNLLAEWTDPPPLAWQTAGLGAGYSGVSIAAGRIYTMGDRGDTCYLIALDAKTGAELWAAEVGEKFEETGFSDPGPKCTPTYSEELVYALNPHGSLVCVSAESGELVWKRELPDDFDGKMMSKWGYAESPLVDGDRLVCTPGGPAAMIVALDKNRGDVIWKAAIPDLGENGRDGAGYGSIVISHGGGVKQYVQNTGRGFVGVAADDGRFLWGYNRLANGTANVPTALVHEDYIFAANGYGGGAALLKLVPAGKGVDAEEVYFLGGDELQNHHGGLVLVDGYVYCGHGHNNGFPTCIEMMTGKPMWKRSRGPGKGSAAVAYADGNLYFRYQKGVVALIRANPAAVEIVGKFKIPVELRSWSQPTIFGGRLYLREQDVLYCYNVQR